MLIEDLSISNNMMQKNYSHCPLKKRPVPPSVKMEERPSPIIYKYEEMDDEPENLSTKPEDLSRTGNYPSKASSPAVGAAPAHSPSRRWHSIPAHSPILTHLPPQITQIPARIQPAPLSPYLPLSPPSIHTHLPPYPSRPTPLEPLNLNSPPEQYCNWPRTSPAYTTYLPLGYGHPETYSGLSPRAACSPPAHSPPAMSPISLCSGPDSFAGEISAPDSVSSDSGISNGSAPRRRRETASRYQCPDCAKSYSTYSGLSKHRQFHCAAAEGSLAKKSFSCKYCSKVYTSLGALKMHIRTHTLPCKCHLCGKAFSRPWLLQGHIRTHTGEKPFSCHHCRRAFADRSNLRAHLQTHSEVKKYSCASCSKTFSRMSLLGKHLEGGCPGYSPVAQPPLYESYRPEELAAY